MYDRICCFNGEDEFEDIQTSDFLLVTARIAQCHLQWMDVMLYQRAALQRGLICHKEDQVLDTLEATMRYLVMIGWMVFNQMATMNAHIPLYGDGNYKQLRGDIIDHDKRLEELERRYRDVDAELTWTYDHHCQDMDVMEE
jgi:hypothetical protein